MLIYVFILCFFGAAKAECHLNWIHYGGSCYYFSTSNLNWFNSASSCREHDARLAEIETKSEGDFVRNTAIRLNENYWLGGRDDEVEGQWEWSSGKPFTYTNWHPGEPDNYQNQEDCMGVYSGGWFDGPCTSVRQYVCEKEYTEENVVIG